MDAADEERFDTYIFEVIETAVEGVKWRPAGDERKAEGAGLGGLSVNTRIPVWHQFTSNKGGYGSISVLRHIKGYTYKEACAWGDTFLKSHPGTGAGIIGGVDDIAIESAIITKEILDAVVEPGLTKADTYLRSRAIEIADFSHLPVRFLPFARTGESGLVGILTSHDRVVGVQLTYLDAYGRKSLVSPARRRFNLEKAPDAVFAFPAPLANATDILASKVIAEGLEDALSIVMMNRSWHVVGLPGVGTLRHLPVKSGERIIVARDGDERGSDADKALIAGVDHLLLEGALVRVTEPALGEDNNSTLQRDGLTGMMDLIGTASAKAELSDAGEITRLSRLERLDYERERKASAEAMGVRVGALDDLVQKLRRIAGADAVTAAAPPDGSGELLELEDLEPWPDPVEGQAVLDELEKTLRRFIVLGDVEVIVVVLWIIGAHVYREFAIFPRLFITAPEKGCGKTTLLDLLEMLLQRPIKVENITTAALFRTIEAAKPSVLLDEADTFVRRNEELRGIIDSGHKRNGSVIRLVEMDGKLIPCKFSTFAPMALAAIKDLPGTIEDRAIPVKMNRRRADEPVESLYRATGIEDLARKIARWGLDNADELRSAEPKMPEGIINRAANNYHPLLVIAEAIGEAVLERAQKAAIALNSDSDAGSTAVELLSDIRALFLEKPAIKALSSDQLVAGLNLIEDRPWAEINNGRQLTKNGLANRLRAFRISPGTVRISASSTPKGYKLEQFKDVFDRYLPPLPPGASRESTATTPQAAENKAKRAKAKPPHQAPRDICGVTEMSENTSNSAACGVVAVENGEGTPGPGEDTSLEPQPAANGDARPNGRDSGRKRRLSGIDREIVEYDQANPGQGLDQLRKRFSARSKAEIAELLGRTP